MISCSLEILSAPFDTGMSALQQPNGVTFTGRIWGDEFIYWAETQDGYRFVQSGDGWHYYATLNAQGEYTATTYKVGVDTPPASSYQLERTQARTDEINLQIQQFNAQVEINRQWYAQKQAEADAQSQPSVNLKIGIILIEFQDIKHFKTTGIPSPRPNGYLKSDFENMMFSENGVWYDTTGSTPHPENEKIYGSFKDYWYQMSKAKLRVGGQVVNPEDINGVPEWLTADSSREYYANLPYLDRTLAYETIQKATALGLISENQGDSNYYDKYCIIYAQYAIAAGALMVNGDAINGRYHFLAERSGPNLFGGNLSEKSFTHIGIYAHEFGHNIGFNDEYEGDGNHPSDLKYFCLMARGIYNGPERKSACPATLSPYYRILYGWLPQPILIDDDKENYLVEYDYDNPRLYRINPIGLSDMHYLFEIRERQGFDTYIPEPPGTYQNQSGTLLIWQHDITSTTGYHDRIRLKTADFSSTVQSQLEDFFPSSFYQNYQSLNDTTYPMASIGVDYEELTPNFIRPAHFALNGIQKLVNGNTLINEIKLNHPLLIINENSGVWQTVSVPYGLSDYSIASVFPTCTSAYKFTNQYVPVNTLENGTGYWALFPTGIQRLSFSGEILEYIEIPVNSGWNITGSISYSIPIANIITNPSGIINSAIFQYDGGYIPITDYIKPGIGYWISTSSAGQIILDKNANPKQIKQIKFANMDKFIISDADGNAQSLYVSNTDIDTTMRNIEMDLPPLFLELPFDSRFEYDEFVKKVFADSGKVDLSILVHSNSFPVSLSWEINPENGINYSFISDSGLGKTSSISTNKGSAKFNNLDNHKIQLFACADKVNSLSVLPTEYSLEQNFPNPFNPATTIKYALKNDGRVTLKIFNILGEEIKTLVDEVKSAGFYQVDFNASTLSSCVYIYQITTQGFTQARKMILTK